MAFSAHHHSTISLICNACRDPGTPYKSRLRGRTGPQPDYHYQAQNPDSNSDDDSPQVRADELLKEPCMVLPKVARYSGV